MYQNKDRLSLISIAWLGRYEPVPETWSGGTIRIVAVESDLALVARIAGWLRP